MENLMTCSRCKHNVDVYYFGLNRKKKPYKTCDNCRNQKNKNELKIIRNDITQGVNKGFINDYVKLPIMKLENKQDIDISIESIAVLKHRLIIDEGLNTIMRVDGTIWTYKELTKHDPVEYEEGTDPKLDYMPDEYIAPVIVKINGVSHRASVLTWFPLTDCDDAIEMKGYMLGKHHIQYILKKGNVL